MLIPGFNATRNTVSRSAGPSPQHDVNMQQYVSTQSIDQANDNMMMDDANLFDNQVYGYGIQDNAVPMQMEVQQQPVNTVSVPTALMNPQEISGHSSLILQQMVEDIIDEKFTEFEVKMDEKIDDKLKPIIEKQDKMQTQLEEILEEIRMLRGGKTPTASAEKPSNQTSQL